MSKHTPAPWKGCNDDTRCKCGMIWKDPPGIHLATVHHGEPDFTLSEEQYSANWRLMIAAPELLDALEYTLKALELVYQLKALSALGDDATEAEINARWMEFMPGVLEAAYKKGQAAIAAAEGRPACRQFTATTSAISETRENKR